MYTHTQTNCHTPKITGYKKSKTNPNPNPSQKINYFHTPIPNLPQQQQQRKRGQENERIQQQQRVPGRGLACCDRNVTAKKTKTSLINKKNLKKN